MKNEIDHFKQDVEQLRLTAAEKSSLRARLMEREHGKMPVKSPYAFLVRHMRWHWIGALALIALVVVPTSYAAERSLPGDRLYYVKTEILEPLEETLSLSSERRAEETIEHAERRLVEQAALLQENDGSEKETEVTQALLNSKVREAQQEISTIAPKDTQRKIELQKDLLTVLEAYVALFGSATNMQTEGTIDVVAQADMVEDELRASIDAFSEAAGEDELLEEVADVIEHIEERIDETETSNQDDALSDDQRAILEHALTTTARELEEHDAADALEILVFSEQAVDVTEKVEDVHEQADDLRGNEDDESGQ